jgi:Tol biopolymer transport system component
MMKRILIIIIVCILVSTISTSCNTKKDNTEVKTGSKILTEDADNKTQQSSQEKTILTENVEASTEDTNDKNSTTINDSEFELLYNPPSGGSPENIGKIIFSSQSGKTDESGDYYLYIINPDGSNKVKIADFGKFMQHPAWSPEYSRIAYSANVDQKEKIFIMAADGSVNKQLTFGDSRDKFPTWSPDGKYLAYISYRDDTQNLFVVDIYGENIKQLTFLEGENTVSWPSWSPVSDIIAYSFNKAGDELDDRLYTIKADGSEMTEILSSNETHLSDTEPAWSPDGKIMYFFSNRDNKHKYNEIWKVDYYKIVHNLTVTDETKYEDIGLVQISNLEKGSGVFLDHRPRLSPDGKKIVFYAVGQDWNNIGTNLYTINIDGTGLANITKSIDGNEWPDW